jgi:hypothetical protein
MSRHLVCLEETAARPGGAAARRPLGRPLGRRGATTLEFGMIALAFISVLVGIVEASWQYTVASALERATLRASRFGITGQQTRPGAPANITCRSEAIRWVVTSTAGGILKADRLVVSTVAYAGPGGLGGTGGTPGAGTGGEVVVYDLRYEEPIMTGLWLAMVGGPERIVHRSTMVVKNEMFSNATC